MPAAKDITLKDILSDKPERFPVGVGITAIMGKMLTTTSRWKKAIVLIEEDTGRRQIRFYGWMRLKDARTGEDAWRVRQKFNVSIGYVHIIIDALRVWLETEREKRVKVVEKDMEEEGEVVEV